MVSQFLYTLYFTTVYRWEVVEEESGVQLLYKTGGVNFAKTEMAHELDTYTAAMDAHNIRFPINAFYNHYIRVIALRELFLARSTKWPNLVLLPGQPRDV